MRAIIYPVKVSNGDIYASHRGANPYCPNHATGVKLPDDFAIPATELEYIE
jgi:hypothetical protein